MGYPKRSLGAKFHPQSKKEEYPGASPKERLWLPVCRELKACDIVQSRSLDSRCSLTPDSKDFCCSYSVSMSYIHSSFHEKHLFFELLCRDWTFIACSKKNGVDKQIYLTWS